MIMDAKSNQPYLSSAYRQYAKELRSWIKLKSADPRAPPPPDPAVLSADRETTGRSSRDAVKKLTREISRRRPSILSRGPETRPGEQAQLTPRSMPSCVPGRTAPIIHLVCKMGTG